MRSGIRAILHLYHVQFYTGVTHGYRHYREFSISAVAFHFPEFAILGADPYLAAG